MYLNNKTTILVHIFLLASTVTIFSNEESFLEPDASHESPCAIAAVYWLGHSYQRPFSLDSLTNIMDDKEEHTFSEVERTLKSLGYKVKWRLDVDKEIIKESDNAFISYVYPKHFILTSPISGRSEKIVMGVNPTYYTLDELPQHFSLVGPALEILGGSKVENSCIKFYDDQSTSTVSQNFSDQMEPGVYIESGTDCGITLHWF